MKARKVVAALSVPLVVAACAGGDPEAASAQDSVTYLTSFNTFGRDAYVYVAEENGYFDEAGIDVTIEPGTGSVDVMKHVAGGSADFGAADFSSVVVTVANEDLPVTSIAAIHQQTLAAIISLDGHGIAKPADLEGKSIGDQPGSTNQVIFPRYAEAAGIDADAVKFIPSSPPSLPQLLGSHQVDAIGQFVVGEPLIESVAQGKDVVVLPYGDLLPELYGNVLVTSTRLAEKDPELVARFTRALLKGLEFSIENPEETGRILVKYQPTQNPDVATAEVEAMARYVTGDGGTVGSMDPERVRTVIEIMGSSLKSAVSPERLVAFDVIS